MNPEWKAKWIAALRSGAYKQGRRNLRDDLDNFCCVGVLCDIVNPNAWSDATHTPVKVFEKGYYSILPHSVREKVGGPLDEDVYYSMNDRALMTFDEIANYIEANE
jgi:hypothetical protein